MILSGSLNIEILDLMKTNDLLECRLESNKSHAMYLLISNHFKRKN